MQVVTLRATTATGRRLSSPPWQRLLTPLALPRDIVQPGELVRIRRASIGAPAGSIGLITEVLARPAWDDERLASGIYAVHMVGGGDRTRARIVRRLGIDLEVISGNR